MCEITCYSVAKGNLTADSISGILETARRFNSKNEITGYLLFHKNQSIQVLEGGKTVAKNLLSKIDRDVRQGNSEIKINHFSTGQYFSIQASMRLI
jgi:Sensors of blue-light using FAD